MRIHFQPKGETLYEMLRATGPRVATILGGGGAKGGGKSHTARDSAVLLAMELGAEYPGITITIVRRVFDDLKKNHIDPLLRLRPELQRFYRSGDKEIRIEANGIRSRIIFAYAETADDVKRKFLGGYESAIIIVDEAQQFSEEELQWISTAARWTDASGIPEGLCKTLLLFNPGGRGSVYLRRVFWVKQYHGEEKPWNFAFIHIFGWDNYEWFRGQVEIDEADFYRLDSDTRFRMFIADTSEGRKYNAFPPAIREGYLLGNFDRFEGQYFAGVWDEEICVLPKSIVDRIIQPWWQRWMAQDWAFAEHAAHGWFASGKLSPSQWVQYFGGECDQTMDVVILYREHVISNRAEADLAMDIVSMTPQEERKHVSRFFLSQDAFGQRPRQAGAHSVGEQFQRIMSRGGLPSPEPADQERVIGWRWAYNCLRQANLRGTNVSNERAKQGPAFFISAECPQAIACMPLAIRAEDEPDDVERVAGALWEDLCDMVRYGLKFLCPGKTKAPLAVRAAEVYNSVEGDGAEAMTRRAMAIRQFIEKENTVTRVSRGPRWR